jgi:hypothetical protein
MIGDNVNLVQYDDGWYVNFNQGWYGPFATEQEARSGNRGLPISYYTPDYYGDPSFRLIAD